MRPVLFVAFLALLSADVASAQGLPVGFVDVQKVFAQYTKAEELQGQLKKDFDQMVVGQRREKERVAAMKDGLELLVDGSKEQLEQLKKIRLAEIEIELNQRTLTFDLQVKWAEVLKKIYADVQREVKALAEEKGLKLVLMYQSSELKARNQDDVMNNILVRPVLYFDPAADLTADVLARLNK